MEKQYRAVKYLRTSCPDNKTEYRDSIANQSRLIDAFVQKHPEITMVAEKVDDGFSGLFFDRPALKEMVSDIEAGHIDCVIVNDLSRLGRDYIETGRYLRDFFPAYNIRFISVDDGIDSISWDGFDKTIASIKNIFSEQYCYDVSVKTKAVLNAKRRHGEYVGATPIYGYRRLSNNKHQLTPDPNTAPVVQSIFDMKLQGMSTAAIADQLNYCGTLSPLAYKRKNGIPCPTGGFADKPNTHWSAATISRILRDENYTGTLVQGRQRSMNFKSKTMLAVDESEWVKTKNAHPSIISRMNYDAVQRALSLDTRTALGRDKVHIFSGLLSCGCCGGAMTRKTVPYREQRCIYYHCSTGTKNGCHSSCTISEKELICKVTHEVRVHVANIKKLTFLISEGQVREMLQNEYVGQITACEKRIQIMRDFRMHLYDHVSRGIIGAYEAHQLQRYYEEEITRLETEISTLCKKPHFIEDAVEADEAWKQYFLQYASINELERAAVIKMVRGIHVLSTKELDINFSYQSEYDRTLQHLKRMGTDGQKKPKTE